MLYIYIYICIYTYMCIHTACICHDWLHDPLHCADHARTFHFFSGLPQKTTRNLIYIALGFGVQLFSGNFWRDAG